MKGPHLPRPSSGPGSLGEESSWRAGDIELGEGQAVGWGSLVGRAKWRAEEGLTLGLLKAAAVTAPVFEQEPSTVDILERRRKRLSSCWAQCLAEVTE